MTTLQPEKWVSLYADYLLRYAMFRLNDMTVCEDLVQETFLSALRAKDQFKGNSSEKTWLTSILKNKIIDVYRKERKSKERLNEIEFSEFFDQADEENAHWKSNVLPQFWDNSTTDNLNRKEYYNVLYACIRRLSDKHHAILQAKYFEESSSDNICKEFDLSKSNYWVTLHRINLALRNCLELNWFKK